MKERTQVSPSLVNVTSYLSIKGRKDKQRSVIKVRKQKRVKEQVKEPVKYKATYTYFSCTDNFRIFVKPTMEILVQWD